MEASWVSTFLVGAGVAVTVYLNKLHRSEDEGRIRAVIESHEARLDSHSDQIDGIKTEMAQHGERLAAAESTLRLRR